MADTSNLDGAWVKVWTLIKSLTGAVNITKGTLQEQVTATDENLSTLQEELPPFTVVDGAVNVTYTK